MKNCGKSKPILKDHLISFFLFMKSICLKIFLSWLHIQKKALRLALQHTPNSKGTNNLEAIRQALCSLTGGCCVSQWIKEEQEITMLDWVALWFSLNKLFFKKINSAFLFHKYSRRRTQFQGVGVRLEGRSIRETPALYKMDILKQGHPESCLYL